MSNIDRTFLWETEALRERRSTTRSSTTRRGGAVAVASTPETIDDELSFVPLATASDLTGIPVNTLRKWARRGAVVSYLDETTEQPIRMVSLDAVRSRAESLGREISALAAAPGARQRGPEARVTVDLTDTRPEPTDATITDPDRFITASADSDPESHPEVAPPPAPSDIAPEDLSPEVAAPPAPADTPLSPPPGTMIVPISAWEKMLGQLGNLHEAGRDMAEARERAAKAETEATFLRERLKELRSELEVAKAVPADIPPPPPPPPPPRPPRPESDRMVTFDLDPGASSEPLGSEREPLEDFLKRIYRNLKQRLRG